MDREAPKRKSPEGANGARVMSTETVSKRSISTGGLDAVSEASRNRRSRSKIKRAQRKRQKTRMKYSWT